MFALELVEDMRTHRRHARATTDEDHLVLCIARKELAVRAGDVDLVTRLQVENERRHDSRRHLLIGARRWRRNADIQLDQALLERKVRHRVGALHGFLDVRFIFPQVVTVPLVAEALVNLEFRELQVVRRALDLDVTTGTEIQLLPLG